MRDHAAASARDHVAALLTEDGISARLYTAGQPDPDLVIRTSGERWFSGFMTWQSAHADLHVSASCWPDFSRAEFDEALRGYRRRRAGIGVRAPLRS